MARVAQQEQYGQCVRYQVLCWHTESSVVLLYLLRLAYAQGWQTLRVFMSMRERVLRAAFSPCSAARACVQAFHGVLACC